MSDANDRSDLSHDLPPAGNLIRVYTANLRL
jgi:hypothetical protein